MKSYVILADYSTNGLAAQVNVYLGNGWQCHEAMVVHSVDGQTEYLQAMVKF